MTGVVVLLVNFKCYKDALKVTREVSIRPSRIMVQEANGKIFWQTSNVHLGLPITPIRDLGHKRTRVLLVIIVSTSPVRWKRREAIRNTWWRYCNSTEVRNGATKNNFSSRGNEVCAYSWEISAKTKRAYHLSELAGRTGASVNERREFIQMRELVLAKLALLMK